MKSPSPYFKTLENTWFHKYIFGCYYNRLGEKFNLNDTELPNDIIDEYKRLYQEKKDSDIQNFVKKFTNSNTFTSFYHHYWMGDVCDSYGVPLFMKAKKSYFYAKAYQDKYAIDKQRFEEDMAKQREKKKNKTKQQKHAKQQKQHAKQQKQHTKQYKQLNEYNDKNAVYINDAPISTRKNQSTNKNLKLFDDKNAVYIDDVPPKPKLTKSKREITTLINKKLKKKKRTDIKRKLRRLKLEMLELS